MDHSGRLRWLARLIASHPWRESPHQGYDRDRREVAITSSADWLGGKSKTVAARCGRDAHDVLDIELLVFFLDN